MSLTLCEYCGVQLGSPHVLLETDCILGHPDHANRRVGLLCARHYHWIGDTLTQITELAALLPSVLLPGPAGDIRSGTRVGSPSPGNLYVMALSDHHRVDLSEPFYGEDPLGWRDDPDAVPNPAWVLDSWCRLVAEELDRDHDPAATLSGSISYLRQHRHWIAQQLWIDDYVFDLAALHLAVARGVGDSMWPHSIGPCPNCQARLYNTIGIDAVTCTRCRSTWEGVALARLRYTLEQEREQA